MSIECKTAKMTSDEDLTVVGELARGTQKTMSCQLDNQSQWNVGAKLIDDCVSFPFVTNCVHVTF